MSLRAVDLTCTRGGIEVLQGVNLSVEAGRALFLRGPNGSGKTTLLRTLAGLQPPRAGRVEAAPESLTYAAHADGVKATLSVEENLRFWAQVNGTGGIEAALQAFDLDALRHRPAGGLSAGQKRRLGLARLITAGRPVWLLDEPTVSLDRNAVALFEATLRRHCESRGSAVIATHIDIDIPADILDLAPFRARPRADAAFDEAFL
ncbi:cytochrome C biogenesis protein CcmA [Actibacterium mucosum KCTC 23349]|uniref:Cytochrome C biogenesis protein CcmA n=1 Tax=Actibacterium mucosum KCTC 23349 TaxID=1454373 RepID=A0A037ZEK5_9RHOB|nr:heme ABC exporter ATP-binding protein CcmA [Actibacterium mucosum]KAJ54572.1 cytochrome C biogenesis protein CcmA [Actibacterium mucosum KCTC 23349]